MKKVVTLLVALAMVLGLAAGAMADETGTEIESTVETAVIETIEEVSDEVDQEEEETLSESSAPKAVEEAAQETPEQETPAPVQTIAEPAVVVETLVVEKKASVSEPVAAEDTTKKNDKKADTSDVEEAVEDVKAPVEYEIMYHYFDDEGEKEVVAYVLDSNVIEKPEFVPAIEGYTFLFWYNEDRDEELPIEEYVFGQMPSENLVLIALFEANEGEEVIPFEEFVQEKKANSDSSAPAEVVALDSVAKDETELPSFITIVDDPEAQDESANAGVVLLDDDDDEDDEGEVISVEDAEVPLAGPATLNGCSIELSSNHAACMNEGDTITVQAELIGYESYEVELQWQYNDGTGWKDADNGNELAHSFEATNETINYDWRIGVTVTGVAANA